VLESPPSNPSSGINNSFSGYSFFDVLQTSVANTYVLYYILLNIYFNYNIAVPPLAISGLTNTRASESAGSSPALYIVPGYPHLTVYNECKYHSLVYYITYVSFLIFTFIALKQVLDQTYNLNPSFKHYNIECSHAYVFLQKMYDMNPEKFKARTVDSTSVHNQYAPKMSAPPQSPHNNISSSNPNASNLISKPTSPLPSPSLKPKLRVSINLSAFKFGASRGRSSVTPIGNVSVPPDATKDDLDNKNNNDNKMEISVTKNNKENNDEAQEGSPDKNQFQEFLPTTDTTANCSPTVDPTEQCSPTLELTAKRGPAFSATAKRGPPFTILAKHKNIVATPANSTPSA